METVFVDIACQCSNKYSAVTVLEDLNPKEHFDILQLLSRQTKYT